MTRQIRLSKSGKNVLTETDPNEFIFHSAYNTFKILASGTATFTIGSGLFTKTVAHGQSIIPLVFAFMICDTNEEVMLPGFQWFNTSPYDDLGFYQLYVDATNVIFYGRSFKATNTDIKFRYFIFESPL